MKTAAFIWMLSGLLVAPSALAEDIQPGNWNVEAALTMAGEAAPPQTSTLCVKSVNDMMNAGTGCTAKTTSQSGNHLEMALSCNVAGVQMDGTASLTVARTTLDGTLNLAMHAGEGQPMQTVTKLHAVRTGECPKQAPAAEGASAALR